MKVLLVTDTYRPYVNGAAYFTSRLAYALQDRGHDVTVMTTSQSHADVTDVREGIRVYGVKSIWLPVYNKFRVSPLTLFRAHVHEGVKKIMPEIIHLQNHFLIGRGAFEMAKKLDIPLVGTNHFMPENLVHYFHLPAWGERKLQELGWRQFTRIYNQVDIVTAPSHTAACITESSGLNKKVIPLSNGIDLNRFTPSLDGSAFKKKYSIPDKNVLLYVGRLDQEKRLEVIIDAMPIIRKQVDAHLVLAGVGGLEKQMQQRVADLGLSSHVTFTGYIENEDLASFYHVGDIFVIAGIAELQSLVTMEAMASGLPVIAAEAKALPELVHNNENGFLFPPGDSKTLAKKAVQLLQDEALRKKMSEKSLAIIKPHDINTVITRFEDIYRQAIAMHAKKPNT